MLEAYRDNVSSGIVKRFDFYRCILCARLLTFDDERRALNGDNDGSICTCGGNRFAPSWPNSRKEWRQPRIVVFSAKVILGRHVLPWLGNLMGRRNGRLPAS